MQTDVENARPEEYRRNRNASVVDKNEGDHNKEEEDDEDEDDDDR